MPCDTFFLLFSAVIFFNRLSPAFCLSSAAPQNDDAIGLRFLLGKFSDMQTFAGESMTSEGGMAFGYYKEGAHNPTFVYISKALDAEKVRPILTW